MSDDDTGGRERAGRRRRRPRLAWLVVAAAAIGVVAALALPGDDPPVPEDLPLEAWAPYWALDVSAAELSAHAGDLRQISPFWYVATGADQIGIDPNAPVDLADQLLTTARAQGIPVVASIVDAMPAGGMAAVLADPATRAQHVDTIAAFAELGGFDGIDLDYEQFAFADDRATWATTRPAWVAFVTDLAERLYADGRTLTVSVPPVYDGRRTDQSGYWVYDHGAIAPVVDRIRLMAYDFSTTEPGPIAPVDWVEQAVDATADVVGDRSKLVLSIPLYGYNWPVTTIGTCPADQVEGRTGVTIRSVDELIALRDATPTFDDATGESWFTYELELDDGTSFCTQTREVHYVDADGARQRIDIARRARLGGVSLWALGYDDETLWAAIDPVVRPAAATTTTP
jgi:spore germination protein YaaH